MEPGMQTEARPSRRMLRLLLGREARTEEDRETAYYLRVTLLVSVALAVGALLEWVPSPSSRWR